MGNTMNLVQRAIDILVKPKETWPQIEAEPSSVGSIYTGYVVLLAAIPALAGFIGMSLIGSAFAFHVPLVYGLIGMIASYAVSLAGVYVMGLIINALAPSFGAIKNPLSAFKVAAYGATASFVSGAFSLIPGLSIIGMLVSLYSIYLVYFGLPALMKCPTDKAVGYTAVVIVLAIVAGIVMSSVTGMLYYHGMAPAIR